MKERRFDVDWLRVIAMLVVFIFHCTRFFDNEGWHLKVPVAQQSEVLPIVRSFLVSAWFMEMFFLLAGFAAPYSLRRRGVGPFLLDRVKRLLIPLYTVGLFILVVPQLYFDGVTHGRITGTFWQWLPSYYGGLLDTVILAPRNLAYPLSLVPYGFSGHLWFIEMLFLVSLLTLPLLLLLKTERAGRLTASLAEWSGRRGGILLFAIPLAVVQIALRWLPGTDDRTWADFCWYALYFVIGYILAADQRFTESIKKQGWMCLAVWIVVFWGAGYTVTIALGWDPSPGRGFSLLYVLWQIAWSLVSWSAIVFIFSLGAKYLTYTNRLRAYSNEAVLPFYLFHQTIILIVGWFVLQWDIGNLARFLIILVVSFPLIMLLYEVFVRRIGFMRFLFGMAPKKVQTAEQPRATSA